MLSIHIKLSMDSRLRGNDGGSGATSAGMNI
jgi:hypothetical protein